MPGRLIFDNTILAYEMIHFLKRKRTGATSYAALKLDMSKAYDRANRDFMEKIITRLVFDNAFVEQISKCMHIVRYRFKVNGSCTETVIPG